MSVIAIVNQMVKLEALLDNSAGLGSRDNKIVAVARLSPAELNILHCMSLSQMLHCMEVESTGLITDHFHRQVWDVLLDNLTDSE